MKEINFLVLGSAPDPYKVTFLKDGNNLKAFCTCPAGENGLYYKHRFGIMEGEGSMKGIVSENKEDVKFIFDWLPGTDVDEAYKEAIIANIVFEKKIINGRVIDNKK